MSDLDPQSAVLVAWLLDAGTRNLAPEEILAELARRLEQQGLELWRIALSIPTKHPELFVRNVRWSRDGGCRVTLRMHDLTETPQYLDSPVSSIHRGGGALRIRLAGPDADLRYELCRELAAEGATDYWIVPLVFADGTRSWISFTSNAALGFGDRELELLHAIIPPLRLRLELDAALYTMRHLLEVYLGHNAAERVLAGAFRRGTGVETRAAIWFCDMRGFTELADTTPARDVVALLDRFFEAVAGAIGARGGEVLKFVGDAVLAIFPLEGQAAPDACGRALAAAGDALAGVAELNRTRRSARPLELGIALHVGDVMYGNVGARDRLDFTVIGGAVNEVCRIEALCKPLATPVLMTERFVAALGRSDVVSLGQHALKGVRGTREVFTLPGHRQAPAP